MLMHIEKKQEYCMDLIQIGMELFSGLFIRSRVYLYISFYLGHPTKITGIFLTIGDAWRFVGLDGVHSDFTRVSVVVAPATQNKSV